MATDRRLSRNFVLSEFPGWREATEEDVQRLQETVHTILQPTRDRWGPIVPTSWIRREGHVGSGAHRDAGTVDFVPKEAGIREVWEWMRARLVPTGQIGELLEEGDHIHVTRWGVGGLGEALILEDDGVWSWGRMDLRALLLLFLLLVAAIVVATLV